MADAGPLLRWHDLGGAGLRWGAWATEDDTFTPFSFDLAANDLGWSLTAHDVRRHNGNRPPALPIFELKFTHREWTTDQMFALVETVRGLLPALGSEQMWTDEEIRRAHEERWRTPKKCFYAHVFPPGAKESDVCRCQRVTLGLYRELRRREEAPTP